MTHRISFSIRVVSVFLATLFVLYVYPFMAIAQVPAETEAILVEPDFEAITQEELASLYETENEYEAAEVIGEYTELRNATVKHFRMSDGTFRAVDYGSAVHFLGDDGEWTDFDNDLVLNETVDSADSEDFAGYEPEKNDVSIKFAKNTSSSNLLKIKYDDCQISFGLQLANKSKPVIENGEADENDPYAVPGVTSKITYPEVFSGVDLVYIVNGSDVKEYFVVSEDADTFEYTFDIKVKNVVPSVDDEGNAVFTKDDGTVVYTIPKGYMYDSGMGYSEGVTYTVEQVKNKKYTLTVTADEEWITSEERVYPIAVDPTVVIEKYSSGNTIIASQYYSTTQGALNETGILYVGYDSSTGSDLYGYLRVTSLPTLPENTMLCDARFYLYQLSDNGIDQGYSTVGLANMYVSAHECLTDDITEGFSYNTAVEDYTSYSHDTQGTYSQYEVTSLANTWYESDNIDNNGIVLKAINNTSSAYANVRFVGASANNNYSPRFIVTYRHTVGIENYYSYETFDVDRAGTLYLNVNTGHTVLVKDILSTNNLANPYTVSLVYNSVYSNNSFTRSDENGIHTADFSQMNIGYGWKLNAQISIQKVTLGDLISNAENNSETYLIFCDGDGTEHYFSYYGDSEDTTPLPIYQDEDGLGLRIKYNENNAAATYTLYDDKDNTSIFNVFGYIVSSIDSNGNTVIYNYDSAGDQRKLVSITVQNDGGTAKTIATFTYSDTFLTGITDEYGRTTSITYTDSRITGITHPDGTGCIYDYSQTTGYNNLKKKPIAITDGESKKSVRIIYDYYGDRVAEVRNTIYVNTNAYHSADRVGLTYDGSEKTTVRYCGNDGLLNTTDDIENIYQFDHFGRCVNIHTIDPNTMKIYGSSAVSYTVKETDTDKRANRISVSSGTGVQPTNMLMNAGAETLYSASSQIASYFYRPSTLADGQAVDRTLTEKRTGNASMMVSATATTETELYTRYLISGLTVGDTYTFSAYAKSTDIAASTTTGGYYLRVGDYYSAIINKPLITANDDGWVHLSVTFTAAVSALYLYAGMIGAAGTVYFDDFQLVPGSETDQVSIVSNGGFENTSVNYWALDNAAYVTTGTVFGSRAIMVTGSPDDTACASLLMTLNVPATETYVMSAWSYATSVSLDKGTRPLNNPSYCISALITYTDGTTEWHSKAFRDDITGWQYTSLPIVPKEPTKNIETLKLFFSYDYNANTAYFDNVSLVSDGATAFKYDENGNVIASGTTKQSETTSTYTDSDLTGYVAATGAEYTYGYDADHNVTSASWAGVTNTYTYNPAGLVTRSTLRNSSDYIVTSATYDGYGKLTSETDQLGNTTSYSYNSANGSLELNIFPDNSRMVYRTTASNNRPYQVYYDVPNVGYESTVNLSYNKGRLSQINQTLSGGTESQIYSLSYNTFGDMTGLTVGDIVLAQNTYNRHTGALLTSKTSSGTTLSYEYDILGRPTEVLNGTTSLFTTEYSAQGNVSKSTDVAKGIVRSYFYDTIGRTTGVMERTTANVFKQFASYSYDTASRLTQRSFNMDFYADALTDTFTYDANGLLANMVTSYGDTFTPEYNGLKQVDRIKVEQRDLSAYTFYKDYTYKNVSGSRTSNLPEGVAYTNASGTSLLTYGYTYDNMYNITEVTKNGSTAETYTYDDFGKLTGAVIGGNSYAYYYDKTGNITTISKIEDYTIFRTNLVYDTTSGWRDRLVSVNGTAITYSDTAPGLPLSYYNGNKSYNFAWTDLGQLQGGIIGTNTAIMYEYNSDGLRTFRRGNNTNYYYYYDGDRLIAQKWGAKYLLFHYDESDSIYGITYYSGSGSPVKYNLYKNLQGDVVEIRSKYNALLATYNYDAWGNVVSITNSSGAEITDTTHIAHINPIRYRSYYYDDDTGFYYLQSRYYDPAIGRFISSDSLIVNDPSVYGYNLFAYCGNNPVSRKDPSGESWITVVVDKMIEITYCLLKLGAFLYTLCNNSENSTESPDQVTEPTSETPVMPIKEGKFIEDYPYYENSNEYHGAVDIVAEEGTPIYSAFSGMVIESETHWSYGTNVVIKSSIDGVEYISIYAHMSEAIDFTVGEYVRAGDQIGYVGTTGNTSGPHLHFEMRKYPFTYQSCNIDPRQFFVK